MFKLCLFRELWIQDYCAQVCLVASQIIWTEETTRAFEELEGGADGALKDYKKLYTDRIEKLIKEVQRDLTEELRVRK